MARSKFSFRTRLRTSRPLRSWRLFSRSEASSPGSIVGTWSQATHGKRQSKRRWENARHVRSSSDQARSDLGKTRKCARQSSVGSLIRRIDFELFRSCFLVPNAHSAAHFRCFWSPRPGSNFTNRSTMKMRCTGWNVGFAGFLLGRGPDKPFTRANAPIAV